jgi:hypothetical protein
MIKNICLITSVLLLVIAVWLFFDCSASKTEQIRSTFVSDKIATLLTDLVLLEELHQGNISGAVEMLHMELDSGMMILSNQVDHLDPETQTLARDTLETLRNYGVPQ